MRCGIVEDEEPPTALAKLHAALERAHPRPEERRWVEPRLAHLLGLEEGAAGDQENLFSAWRACSSSAWPSSSPTMLVFEDMQWADASLLDFIEYLLDWSREPPDLRAHARPARARSTRARPGARASATSPRSISSRSRPRRWSDAPDRARARAARRATRPDPRARRGCAPLRGRDRADAARPRPARREGNVYRPTGEIETLEVPETLHALDRGPPRRPDAGRAAARAGRRPCSARRSRSRGWRRSPAWRGGGARAAPRRRSCARRSSRSRPTRCSPERGQYGFLQDIVKKVAYETISKKERKTKHLAAAAVPPLALERRGGRDRRGRRRPLPRRLPRRPRTTRTPHEIRDRGARDARPRRRARRLPRRELRGAARVRAGARADRRPARAGRAARARRHDGAMPARVPDEASAHFERAIELFEASSATHPAARVSARLAEIMWDRGRLEQGLESMDRAFEVLAQEEPDEDLAALAAQLGRFMFFAGRARSRHGADRDGARHRRGSPPARDALAGAQHEGDHPHRSRALQGRARASALCTGCRARARQAVGRAPRVLQPRRHARPRRPVRGARAAVARDGLALRAGSATATGSGSSSARDTRSSRSASGTRC